MTGEQLKKSILQYAVEGKLVPQDLKDEPASVLIEKIKEEKERLIEEKVIKRDKNESFIYRKDGSFYEKIGKKERCIDEELPFDIPDNWEWARLESISNLITDGTHKTPKYVDKGIKFLSVKNISSGEYDESYIKYITEEEHEKLITRCKPENGDILLCRIGTLGKPYIIELDFEFSIFVSLALIKLNNKKLNRFIKNYMESYSFMKTIDEIKVGGGSHTYKINLRDLNTVLIPIPPLAEQERIVAKIEELMPLVEEYGVTKEKINRLNEELPEKMKKSILQYAIEGKLIPQNLKDEPASVLIEKIKEEKERLIEEKVIKRDKKESFIYRKDGSFYEKIGKKESCIDEELSFDIPDNWEWARLGSIFDVRDGTHDTPKYVQDGIPLVTSKNLCDGKIDFSTCKFISEADHNKISARSNVEYNDILFAMIGSIGNPVLCEVEKRFSIKNVALFKNISNMHYMKYLYYYLLHAQSTMKKKAAGAVQSFVSLTFLRTFLIPIPPLEEQKRIVAKIEEILPMIEKLK